MATKTITKTVTEQIRVCDFCNASNIRCASCYGCERDICAKCGAYLAFDPFNGEPTGDYPPMVCKKCSPILKPFRKAANELRQKYENELEIVRNGFKAACQKPIKL